MPRSFSSHRTHSSRSPELSRRTLVLSTASLFASTFAGCAYRFGSESLYPCDVRTICVPMFDSISFRRGLGERLTEAVVREIEVNTPYKVVNSPTADSTLTGRIVNDLKAATLSSPTGEARTIQINWRVEVSWTDRRGKLLQAEQSIPLPESIATIDQATSFIPEGGQSMATAQQKEIERLAKQIVSLMEAPW